MNKLLEMNNEINTLSNGHLSIQNTTHGLDIVTDAPGQLDLFLDISPNPSAEEGVEDFSQYPEYQVSIGAQWADPDDPGIVEKDVLESMQTGDNLENHLARAAFRFAEPVTIPAEEMREAQSVLPSVGMEQETSGPEMSM